MKYTEKMVNTEIFPKEIIEVLKTISEQNFEAASGEVQNIIDSKSIDFAKLEIRKESKSLFFMVTHFLRIKAKQSDVRNILQALDVQDSIAEKILEFYNKVFAKTSLEIKLSQNTCRLHFKYLEWRFQVTLASRSLMNQCEQKIVSRVSLGRKDVEIESKEVVFEMDVNMLQKMVTSLEEALNESNSPTVRKLLKS